MNPHILLMFCSVLWYLCVLFVWVWLGRSMSLFGNHSLNGWIMVGAAFIFSAVANLIVNPLAWTIAALSIWTAKSEGRSSLWRFYAPVLGIILILVIMSSVVLNMIRTQKSGLWKGPLPLRGEPQGQAPAGRALTVMGIMYSEQPTALVNDHVVTKGDVIDGFEVVEIRPRAVLFRDEKGIFEELVR